MPLNKDWREFVELLNSNEVEYLVVGAFAVAFHGFPRYTAGLDLWVRPTDENANRVLRALSEEGEYDSNKQIHADMEELSDSLCLLLRHGSFSSKDLRHPALGANYGPKIFWG